MPCGAGSTTNVAVTGVSSKCALSVGWNIAESLKLQSVLIAMSLGVMTAMGLHPSDPTGTVNPPDHSRPDQLGIR
jgi:hypothetical protein